MRWEVYNKEKEELANIYVSVFFHIQKVGKIVWTCVKDHIIYEKEDNKYIGLCGFHYKLLEEEDGKGTIEK